MQITLIQTEIEQALRNYINEQVNIKEGTSVSIELRSTRGSEGMTAIIDIIKTGTAAPVKAEVPTTPVKREVEEAPTIPLKSGLGLFKSDAAPAADQSETEETAGVVAEGEPVKKKSLFGSLQKPSNKPAADPAVE